MTDTPTTAPTDAEIDAAIREMWPDAEVDGFDRAIYRAGYRAAQSVPSPAQETRIASTDPGCFHRWTPPENQRQVCILCGAEITWTSGPLAASAAVSPAQEACPRDGSPCVKVPCDQRDWCAHFVAAHAAVSDARDHVAELWAKVDAAKAGDPVAAAVSDSEKDDLSKAGWLAQLVIDKLGGTNDLPAWAYRSAKYYAEALDTIEQQAKRLAALDADRADNLNQALITEDALAKAEERLAEVERDAARYRWLKDHMKRDDVVIATYQNGTQVHAWYSPAGMDADISARGTK